MSRIRRLFILIVVATLLSTSAQPASALLIRLSSVRNIPFSATYPKSARMQIRAALQCENCKFIEGRSVNAVSTLHFGGDTTSVNELLKQLTDCPATTIAVTFQMIDRECDWQIIYNSKSMKFDVIINLYSKRISLKDLIIPPAKGPELHR